MTGIYDGVIQNIIDEIGRLPGIGPKSAQRIAFFILADAPENVESFANTLREVKQRVRFCKICANVCQEEICKICADPRRTDEVICVVEEAKDVIAIERTREYRGKYHVIGGAINPIAAVGPDDLNIRSLMTRLADETVKEVILATNPNIEGEATATYLSRLLSTLNVPVTRLASGLPMGGDLEYADEVTLVRAFEGRHRLNG